MFATQEITGHMRSEFGPRDLSMAPPPAAFAAVPAPRAVGEASLRAVARDGRTRIADLRHAGSAKMLFPDPATRAPGPLEAVVINTAGGVTGGDVFTYTADAEANAWVRLTTQAAERAYRAQPGERASLRVRLSAAPGARIDWLPQETILFNQSSLARRLDIDLAGNARCLAVEAVLLGRAAMGERADGLWFSDQWRIRRDGRLLFADALRLEGDAADYRARAALLGGAGAFASLLWIDQAAAAKLTPLREALGASGGASLIAPDVLAARLVASDGFALRRALLPALELLSDAPLPKVWRL